MFLIKLTCLIFLTLLLYFQLNNKKTLKVNLNIAIVFLGAYILYIIIPLIEVFINGEINKYSKLFVEEALVATIFINIGVFVARKVSFSKKSEMNKPKSFGEIYYYNSSNLEMIKVLISTVICFVCIFIFIQFNKGGVYSYFVTGYGQRTGSYESTTIGSLIYSAIAYAIVFNNRDIIKYKRSRYFAHIVTLIFVGIFVLGGNRNIAIMILLAMLLVVLKEKKINILKLGAFAFIGAISMGFVAVFREYGLMNVLKGKVILNYNNVMEYVFNFRNGELGTTFKFATYSQHISDSFSFPFGLGYSYVILPIVNLIPRSLWENKPVAYADYFSKYAFGDVSGLGFGFSPIYEAKVNFGFLWGIVFIVIGFIIMKLTMKYSKKEVNIKLQLLTFSFSCIILNFFRIDFTTFFKFFMMIFLFALFFYKLTLKRRKRKIVKDDL